MSEPTLSRIAQNFGVGATGTLVAVQSMSFETLLGRVSLVAGTIVTVLTAVNAIRTWWRGNKLAAAAPIRPAGGCQGRPGHCCPPRSDGGDA